MSVSTVSPTRRDPLPRRSAPRVAGSVRRFAVVLAVGLVAVSGCGAVGGDSSSADPSRKAADVDVVRLVAVPLGLVLVVGLVGGVVWLGFHMDKMGDIYRVRREYRRDVRRTKRRARRQARGR